MDSREKGMKDGAKGQKDSWEYAFNEDYYKGYDYGGGARARSERDEYDEYMDKHPIAGPISDSAFEMEKAMKSEEYQKGYDRKPYASASEGRHRDAEESAAVGSSSYGGAYGSGGRYSGTSTTWEGTVSSPRRTPVLLKWILGLAVLVIIGGLAGQFWSLNTSTTSSGPPPSFSQKNIPAIHTSGPLVLKYRSQYSPKKEINPQTEANLGKWIKENLGLKINWVRLKEGAWEERYIGIEDYTTIGKHLWAVGDKMGHGYIFYSPDGGESWELQWEEPQKLFGRSYPFIVYFSTEKEGWVGSKDGLYYTQDGGRNWEFRNVPGKGNYIGEYWFYENYRIKASFVYGETYASLDGGKNWK